MMIEVSVTVSFITSYLYNKLPRRRVDMFAEELQKNLAKKLADYWSPDQPEKGRSQRCLRVNGRCGFDSVMLVTATDCGLDIQEILRYLPADLVIWIDPKEVSYRFAENETLQTLYSEKFDGGALGNVNLNAVAAAATAATSSSNRDLHSKEIFAVDKHAALSASSSLNYTPQLQSSTATATAAAAAAAATNSMMLGSVTGNFNDPFSTPRVSTAGSGHNNNSNIGNGNNSAHLHLHGMKDMPAIYSATAQNQNQNNELESLQSRLAALAFSSFSAPQNSASLNGSLSLSTAAAAAASATVPASASASVPTSNNNSSSSIQKSPSNPSFTAASFAQTKFGSVKLRTQNRRPPAITAADLVRHQRAYSANSPTVPSLPSPSAMQNSLPLHAASAWLNAQPTAAAPSFPACNNQLNSHQIAALQQQLAASSLKQVVGPTLSNNIGNSMLLNGLNTACRSDTSPLRSPVNAQQKQPFANNACDSFTQADFARMLTVAGANKLFGMSTNNGCNAGNTGESSETVDALQLAAMCNLYQSKFINNQTQLEDNSNELHKQKQQQATFYNPENSIEQLQQSALERHRLFESLLITKAGIGCPDSSSGSLNASGNSSNISSTSNSNSTSLPDGSLSASLHLDNSQAKKEEFTGDSGTGTSNRSSQHLLLAN